MTDVAIVGGGISGLSAAYFLAERGYECTLIEAQSRLGGVIRSERVDGCLVEAGPDSFLAQKPWALELIRELGMEDQVIGSQDRRRRTYVLRKGKLIVLPEGIQFLAPTRLRPMLETPLLSWSAKARMALEWFRKPEDIEDESVAEFVRRHYGPEVNEYLAQPMLAGVYGGSPEKLSMNSVLPRFVEMARKDGSLTKSMLRARRAKQSVLAQPVSPPPLFQSLRNGMQQLTDALVTQVQGRVRIVTATLERLETLPAGYHLRTSAGPLEAQQVILATPAYRAAEVVKHIDARLADLLLDIPYHSSITVSLLYSRPEFDHRLNGFGYLVPRAEGKNLAACTWVNTKFPFRADRKTGLLRAFLAGDKAEQYLSAGDSELAEVAHRELSEAMGFAARPASVRVQRWERAMAQYEVGHQKRLVAIEGRLRELPGLHLGGNGFTGIGIPDCVRRSRSIAEQVGERAAARRGRLA